MLFKKNPIIIHCAQYCLVEEARENHRHSVGKLTIIVNSLTYHIFELRANM